MNDQTNDTAGRPLLFTPDGRDASATVREPVEYEIGGRSMKFIQTEDELDALVRKFDQHGGQVQFLHTVPIPGAKPDAHGKIQATPAVVDQVSLAHVGLIWMLLQKAWQRIEVLEKRLDERDREEGRDIGP